MDKYIQINESEKSAEYVCIFNIRSSTSVIVTYVRTEKTRFKHGYKIWLKIISRKICNCSFEKTLTCRNSIRFIPWGFAEFLQMLPLSFHLIKNQKWNILKDSPFNIFRSKLFAFWEEQPRVLIYHT